jgi:hypothetical protein
MARQSQPHYDVIVIGAGAAGMMCAATAGQRGRSVLLVDHYPKLGEKIRISGGGRCNFTNLSTALERFLSRNHKFALSALSRFRPADFIARVDAAGIAWHERTLGQLFCDGPATQIVSMLVRDLLGAGGTLHLGAAVAGVSRSDRFRVETAAGTWESDSLIIATGGKSVPKMGATGLGYRIAEAFGLPVTETRPALVPLTFTGADLEAARELAGISAAARVTCGATAFEEGLLFTHRGLSGPSILQISSYWREGDALTVDLARGLDTGQALRAARAAAGRQAVQTALARHLPERLAAAAVRRAGVSGRLADLANDAIGRVADAVHRWTVRPAGSEGYRTAEVTLGGVDTDALDARTMMARAVPGLYFVGEVVDVTGWLGGYNFQWAWSSGWAAGQAA